MNLSELIPFLKNHGVKPQKKLSQNFLIDPSILRKIVELAEVSSNDHVLEIGSGPGALTSKLLKLGAKVTAVEIDPLFAQHLNNQLKNGNLTVFESDFLKFAMDFLPPNIKVVANLPYHITTPILEKLFTHPFSSITIMVQKEVADRIQANPGTKDFSSLSLFVQFHSKIKGSFNVPASCFYPKPKVDSTVLRLDATPIPDANPFHLIRPAFQQRRKMLTSTLPYPREQIQKGLISLGMRVDARPEMLSLNHWVKLSKTLLKAPLTEETTQFFLKNK